MIEKNRAITETKPIRAAIFGTSMSGTERTIEYAQGLLRQEGLPFDHISLIELIQDELNECSQREMSEEDEQSLVKGIRERTTGLSDNMSVFVDEHFSFPVRYGGAAMDDGRYIENLPSTRVVGLEDRYYEVVFQEEWILYYDLAVYMEIDPEIILARFLSFEDRKNYQHFTKEDIRLWQLFELERIQNICNRFHIPLYYIYDHEKSGKELAMIVMHHLRHCSNQKKQESGDAYEV